jgi:pyrimidine operon attenuation protein/uracil phosphoribosyltransferase
MNKNQTENDSILLMNRHRILRTVERMAYQIDEDYQGDGALLVAGIKKRGNAVARSLAESLDRLSNHPVCRVQLPAFDVEPEPAGDQSFHELPQIFDYILLVDDVIFSGQTMLCAIENVKQHFNTMYLRTAVLVDRGHRKVPVEASFYGISLPTKLDEHVLVCLDEHALEKVILTKSSDK